MDDFDPTAYPWGLTMRTALCLLLLAAACTCKKSPPAPSAPYVSDDELQRFLNGMLITPPNPAAYDMLWPLEDWKLVVDNMLLSMEKGWGFKTREEIRGFIDLPISRMNRSHGWVHGRLMDTATSLQIWKKLLKDDEHDLEAAILVLENTYYLEGAGPAIEAVAGIDSSALKSLDERSGSLSAAEFEGNRCGLLLRAHRLDEAEHSCHAAIAIDHDYGSRTLAKVLLANGKLAEGLEQARRVAAMPGRGQTHKAALTLGLAQQLNGDEAQALATWKAALAKWPNNTLLLRAITGEKRSVIDWAEDEDALLRPDFERSFAFCGHFYADLGMEDRSRDCYRRSEALGPNRALAQKIVHLGETDLDAALVKARAVVRADSHVDLLSAMAWLLLQKGQLDEAKQWVDRALKAVPWDVRSLSLKWQLCGKEKDYLCLIDYRKRLGLPTHFNVAEYNIVANAWKEQAWKNGEGLAAPQADSEHSPTPPPVAAIEVVPMGARVPPELTDLLKVLGGKFGDVKVRLAPVEPLPAGTFKPGPEQVVWERLVDKLGDRPGRIFVIEEDLVALDSGFAFSRFDLAHGRGVISLSRLRSLTGTATPAGTTLDENVLDGARGRLLGQLGGAIGMLLGMSFPCPVATCAMRERRSVADFATTGFCERHHKELAGILGSRRAKGLAIVNALGGADERVDAGPP